MHACIHRGTDNDIHMIHPGSFPHTPAVTFQLRLPIGSWGHDTLLDEVAENMIEWSLSFLAEPPFKRTEQLRFKQPRQEQPNPGVEKEHPPKLYTTDCKSIP